jgi:hypothetical protein
MGRELVRSSLVVLVGLTLGCDAPAEGKATAASPTAPVASPTAPATSSTASAARPSTAAAPMPAPAAAPAPVRDPLDPCTWVTTEEVNSALSATLAEPTKKDDEARQIATCNWAQASPFGIVDLGVSLTPGADAFQTNMDLAPAYFDGEARPLTIAGAEKAYLVSKDDPKASIIGMLVGGRFVLLQVAIADATAERAQALAATIASRLK